MLYIVVHHSDDPHQPFVNAWQDEYSLEAIETTEEVVNMLLAAGRQLVGVHRCAIPGVQAQLCKPVRVRSIANLAPRRYLVKFDNDPDGLGMPENVIPPVHPLPGQNYYYA